MNKKQNKIETLKKIKKLSDCRKKMFKNRIYIVFLIVGNSISRPWGASYSYSNRAYISETRR